MAARLDGIQPAILKWARESQGYTIAEIAGRMKRDPADIVDWESGASTPTYRQLEDLAYRHYKRPLATFFLPGPPVEAELKREFRTLPDAEIDALSADTRYQLRLGHAYQFSLRELTGGRNPSARPVFRALHATTTESIPDQARLIRSFLQFSMEEQSLWRNPDKALRILRDKVADAGVFVFKNGFKQKEISGFCLNDEEFPIICINNGTSKTRQIFTLFHELSHLLLRMNGISKVDLGYVETLPGGRRSIERFCNALAAEILIPSDDFDRQMAIQVPSDDAGVARVAARYCVSREAVFRRLLDRGEISNDEYRRKVELLNRRADKTATGSGGNYYLTRGAYLGEPYLRLVFGKYYSGQISLEQTAGYLGVKTGSVQGLDPLAPPKAAES